MCAQDKSDSEWLLARSGLSLGSAVPADVKFWIGNCYCFFALVKSEYVREGILKSDSLLMTLADPVASAAARNMFQCKF